MLGSTILSTSCNLPDSDEAELGNVYKRVKVLNLRLKMGVGNPVIGHDIVGKIEDYLHNLRDRLLPPTKAQAAQEKSKQYLKPIDLDRLFGEGVADGYHPVIKQINPTEIGNGGRLPLDEATVKHYREIEGLPLYHK